MHFISVWKHAEHNFASLLYVEDQRIVILHFVSDFKRMDTIVDLFVFSI